MSDKESAERPIPPEVGLKQLRALRESGALPHEAEAIMDLMQLVSTILLDLIFLRKAFKDSTSPWERRVFGRHLSLVAYESLEDIPQALAKVTQNPPSIVDTRGVEHLTALRNDLKVIKRIYNAELKTVRDAAAAHRELNVLKLYEVIDALDLERLERVTFELLMWITRCYLAATIASSPLFGTSRSIVEQVEDQLRKISDL